MSYYYTQMITRQPRVCFVPDSLGSGHLRGFLGRTFPGALGSTPGNDGGCSAGWRRG